MGYIKLQKTGAEFDLVSADGIGDIKLDAMEVNFLSERCLVTQAANNFVLFKGI